MAVLVLGAPAWSRKLECLMGHFGPLAFFSGWRKNKKKMDKNRIFDIFDFDKVFYWFFKTFEL